MPTLYKLFYTHAGASERVDGTDKLGNHCNKLFKIKGLKHNLLKPGIHCCAKDFGTYITCKRQRRNKASTLCTIKLAQSHALRYHLRWLPRASLEDGKLVEEVGQSLESGDLLGEESPQSIEKLGESIEEKSQEFLAHSQQLASIPASTEVFSECVQAHIDVNQSHIKAVKDYQSQVKTYLNRVK